MPWIDIGAVQDFADGSATELIVAGRVVAVFKLDGTHSALDGICPHQGGPLGKGTLTGCVLTCPWHGWQFDVRDGQSQLSPAVRQTTIETRVEADRVLVHLHDN
jgi:nitrite reductase/ring-hydroxylating ferredoxin subunit